MTKYAMGFYDTREALKEAVEEIDTTVPLSVVIGPEFGRICYALIVGTAPTP